MKSISVASFISERIAFCEKTQVQIAKEIGITHPNFLSMIKTGKTKLPLSRVAAVAMALETDPFQLLTMCLAEYQPDTWEVIRPYFQPALASKSSVC